MNVLDIGRSDYCKVLFFYLLTEVFRYHFFKDVLAHFLGKPGANQAGRRFARTESWQARLFLNSGYHAFGGAVELLNRNNNFDFVFTTFYKHLRIKYGS